LHPLGIDGGTAFAPVFFRILEEDCSLPGFSGYSGQKIFKNDKNFLGIREKMGYNRMEYSPAFPASDRR